MVSRRAHNPKTGGSIPSPATKKVLIQTVYSMLKAICHKLHAISQRLGNRLMVGPRTLTPLV